MKKRIAIFAFNGEPRCFAHALINALDMQERGFDVKLVIEGSATKLVRKFMDATNPFYRLYEKAREAGLIDCVCKACANRMAVLPSVEAQELPVCDEMHGHPSMARYIEEGYEIIAV